MNCVVAFEAFRIELQQILWPLDKKKLIEKACGYSGNRTQAGECWRSVWG